MPIQIRRRTPVIAVFNTSSLRCTQGKLGRLPNASGAEWKEELSEQERETESCCSSRPDALSSAHWSHYFLPVAKIMNTYAAQVDFRILFSTYKTISVVIASTTTTGDSHAILHAMIVTLESAPPD